MNFKYWLLLAIVVVFLPVTGLCVQTGQFVCDWTTLKPEGGYDAFAAQPGGVWPIGDYAPKSYNIRVGPSDEYGIATVTTWKTYGPYQLRAGHKYRALITSDGLRFDEDTGDLNSYDVSPTKARVFARNQILGDTFYGICLTPVGNVPVSTCSAGQCISTSGKCYSEGTHTFSDGNWKCSQGKWSKTKCLTGQCISTSGKCYSEGTHTFSDGDWKCSQGKWSKTGGKEICGSWSGTWDVPGPWGQMVLKQSGNDLTGTYTHEEGILQGTISGNKFIGTWAEIPSRSPPDDAGDVEFTLSDDCSSFSGTWLYGSSGNVHDVDGHRTG